MRAAIGDTLHIHSHHLGTVEHTGKIIEVRGTDGAPPYLVRFGDGSTKLLYPGPDAVVEHPQSQARPPAPAAPPNQPPGSSRRIHTRPGW